MSYAYDLENGQRIVVQNDGEATLIALSSESTAVKQSLVKSLHSGRWLKPPELFQLYGELILRLENKGGMEFARIRSDQIELMLSGPELEHAEKLKLRKIDESTSMNQMRLPKPSERMESTETEIGGRRISTGGRDKGSVTAKRYCPRCFGPVRQNDSFCASCRYPLSDRKW
jgi:hypothetical protein